MRNVLDAIVTIDERGVMDSFNPSATEMFGYEPAEVLGRNVSILMPEPAAAAHDGYLAAYLGGGPAKIIGLGREVEGRRRDGSTFPLELAVSETSVAGHRLFVGVLRDLTERKAIERQQQEARLAAERANRAKSQFLANMSHEIRTPLNGVIGMAEILRDSPLPPRQAEMAATIANSGRVLVEIVNDVLDFSKIEAGELRLEFLPLRIRDVVEEVLDMHAAGAQTKGLELTGLVSRELDTGLQGDRVRLGQILHNLVGNAVKFTSSGEVAVEVSRTPDDAEGQALLRFEIRDTGIGIAEAALSELFQPFVQADGSTSRRFGGTGLGLSICRELTAMMGGEIGVESVPGEGSTFWFTARLERVDASEGVPPLADLSEVRVLAVDDNATNLRILEHHLSGWGALTRCASNGALAIQRVLTADAAGEPFHLVVLDHQMPGLTGLDVARAIAGAELTTPPVVLMLTSIGAVMSAQRLAEFDIVQCLAKPVRPMVLLEAVLRALRPQPQTHFTGVQRARGSEAPHWPAGTRALVAEDNPINQQVTALQLERLGIASDVVGHGKAAVAAACAERYDVILMDCHMPVQDGYQATRELRAAGVVVPVIALTAAALRGERERCLAVGMNDYLTKPVTNARLAKVLQRYVGGFTHSASLSARDAVVIDLEVGDGLPLDPRAIEQLLALGRASDRPTLVGDMIGRFVADLPETLRSLRAVAGDLKELERRVHTLKSSAATLGAHRMATTCEVLEAAVVQGDHEALTSLFVELETEAEVARVALQDRMAAG